MADQKLQVELTGDSSGLLGAISKGLEGLKGFAEGVKEKMTESSTETGKYSETLEHLKGKVAQLREKWLELKTAQAAGKGGDLIGAEVKNAERALKGASAELASFKTHSSAAAEEGNKLSGVIQGIGSVSPGAGSALGAFAEGPLIALAAGLVAAIGAGVAFVEFLDHAVDRATEFDDHMGKTAQKVGVSTEAISGLSYAAKLLDVDQETVAKRMGKFEKAVYEAIDQPTSNAAKALRKLGLEGPALKEALKDPQSAMETISERFSQLKDDGAKTALAMEIFGKSGKDMIPFLNAGAEKLKAAREEAAQFGLVTSGPAAEAAEHLAQNTKRLHGFMEGLELQIGRTLIPVLGDLTDDLLGSAKDGADPLKMAIQSLGTVLITGVTWVRLMVVEGKSWANQIGILIDLNSALRDALYTMDFSAAREAWKNAKEGIVRDNLATEIQSQVIIAQDTFRKFQLWSDAAKEESAKKGSGADLGSGGGGPSPSMLQGMVFWTKKEQETMDTLAKIREKGFDQLRKLTEVYYRGEAASREQQIGFQEKATEEALKKGEISNAEYIRRMRAFEEEKYQIAFKALKDEAELEEADPVKKLEIWNKIELLAQAHSNKMLQIAEHTDQSIKQESQALLNGVRVVGNGFSRMLVGLISDSRNATSYITGFFKSMFSALINGFAQLITKTLLYKAVTVAANHDIITSDTQKRIAQMLGIATTKEQITVQNTKTATESADTPVTTTNTVANIFQAHSGIPFVGAIIAAALVAVMLATMSKAKGRAVGGLVGEQGPELTMLGEKGLEVVAPEHDFKDWARGLVGMGANLGANLTYHRAQVEALNRTAASYASAPLRQDSGDSSSAPAGHTIHVHMNGPILDSSNRGMQQLGRHVMDAARLAARQIGVTVQPGQTFGGL